MGEGWMAADVSSPQKDSLQKAGGGAWCLAHLATPANQVSNKPEHLPFQGGTLGVSLPSPREPLLPGSLRGTACSEDKEVNTEVLRKPQKHCQPPGVLKLPGSSHLSRQLHLEKALITPCPTPCMPWQVIKHPTLSFKRGGNLSDS